MLTNTRAFLVPLLGLAIFSVANGYLMSLVPLRLSEAGGSDMAIGAVAGVFHFGLLLGAFRTERLISAIGHIRAFTAFMAMLGALVGLQAFLNTIGWWMILRLLSGVAVSGIFVVVESWLLSGSKPTNRGTLLALYMIAYYSAGALGQLLLKPFGIEGYEPFLVILILLAISSIPPSLTRLAVPPMHPPSELNIRRLYTLTPSGVVGCLASGLAIGALYGLLPLHFSRQGADNDVTGYFVAATLVGGMVLQYPLGKLSDYIDRRKVLAGACLLGVGVACILLLPLSERFQVFWLFLLGGVIFTLYPLAISHGCDHMQPKDIVAATQGLLLAYSFGATLGPLIGSAFMVWLQKGLFWLMLLVTGFLLVFFMLRMRQRLIIVTGENDQFTAMPTTSAMAPQLNPRVKNTLGNHVRPNE